MSNVQEALYSDVQCITGNGHTGTDRLTDGQTHENITSIGGQYKENTGEMYIVQVVITSGYW